MKKVRWSLSWHRSSWSFDNNNETSGHGECLSQLLDKDLLFVRLRGLCRKMRCACANEKRSSETGCERVEQGMLAWLLLLTVCDKASRAIWKFREWPRKIHCKAESTREALPLQTLCIVLLIKSHPYVHLVMFLMFPVLVSPKEGVMVIQATYWINTFGANATCKSCGGHIVRRTKVW